ncbi:Zinc finger A20 and AN1 domain-containing stress-associated protein4 [Zostera marina]|uniref:Zinc finger A20 and AN1 domain-containing stress-associated protein4 n=1 Tax=Zostera marina TaxID=29655 RepID=A0A0K9PY31_ZOSMR|nr:Zinc finger A20 and AN1 domain-containing stress-associated protein4 [Zostera marina]
MEHKEAGCKVPEGPILCINNCGFFGSAATMNMCSKCHKDMVLKEEHAQLAASSIDSIMNGSGSSSGKEPIVSVNIEVPIDLIEPVVFKAQQPSDASVSSEIGEMKVKEGPARCGTCRKRVGLMGFNCRCGHVFCAMHRYSDKHECSFDYRSSGRDAISKANPVVKSEKLDKI